MLKPKHKTYLLRIARLCSGFLCLGREQRTSKSRLLVVVRSLLLVVALTGVFLYTRAGTPTRVEAATSSTLNFQARLYTSAGSTVPDGNYHIEFKLHDNATTAGGGQGTCTGSCLWRETRSTGNLVNVKNGYFSVNLGSVTGFPALNWDQDMWLSMNIGGTTGPTWDGEMSPRIKLTAVPYALKAGGITSYNGTQSGNLSFSTVANSPDIKLPDVGGTNNVLLQSGTTLFTQGSIPFTDSTGRLTQDNASFYFDDSTDRLGILDNTPAYTLTVGAGDLFGVQGADGSLIWEGSSADANETILRVQNPTADLIFELPNVAAGTYDVCTSANNCSSLGAYIQNGTALQSNANFNIQSVGDTSRTATIRARATQTADLLQFRNSGDTQALSGFTANGSLYFVDPTGGETITISVQNGSISANRSITLPNADGEICTTAGNCVGNGGAGDVFKNGQAGPLIIGTNDNTSFYLETNNNNRIEIQGDGDVLVGNSTRITASATSVLTGSIDPIASTAVTGVGTLFTTELTVGDRITVSGETRTVTVITSNTALTVDTAFSDNLNDTSPDRLPAQFVVRDSSSNVDLILQDNGNVGIGVVNPTALLSVGTASAFSVNGSGQLTFTGVATDITTGTNEDLTVVANGTGQIILSDTVQVATLGTADNVSYICRNSSNQLAGCNTTGTGAAFVQGGNSFGAQAVLGTNDNNSLAFETNNNTKLVLDTSGNLAFQQASTISTSTGNLAIQANGTSTASIDTSGAGTVEVGRTNAATVSIGNTSATTALTLDAAASSTINVANSAHAHTINIGTGAAAQTITIGSTNTTSTTTLQAGSGNLVFGASQAQFSEVTGTRTLTVQTRTTNVTGTNLTISAGTAGSGASAFTGGTLTLQGGAAGGTGNANGANVVIQGGAGVGTGVQGLVTLSASSFIAASTQSFGTNGSIAQAVVDNNSAVPVNATAVGLTITLPAPTQNVVGRILYITVVSGSSSFTIAPSGGTSFTLNQNVTATFIWNGSAWTNAGVDGGSAAYIQNQSSQDQSANFRISGSGRANTSFISPLFTTLDSQGSGNSPDVTFRTGNASTGNNNSSGSVTIKSGDATNGSNGSSGNVTIDSGAKVGSGTSGSITLGATNASAVTIARTGVLTRVDGNFTLGASAGSGTLLTNNGATVNTTLALGNFATGGSIGTAATTVDIYTSISVAQTTASQTLTIPTPTASTTYGRLLYISNIGTTGFTLLGATLNPGATATLMWSNTNGGAAWTYAGADGSSILNQNSADQTGNFRISGTGRANTSLQAPLFDTATNVALAIGTTNATAINLNQNTTIAAAKTLTVTSGATSLTGASTGDALTVNNSTSTGNIFVAQDNGSTVFTIADGGLISLTQLGAASNDTALCRNSSNQIATCNSTFVSTTGYTLQGAYANDVNGSDTRIDLTDIDDSLIFSNPAASGSDSSFVLEVEQLATSGTKGGLLIDHRGDSFALRVDDSSGDTTPFVIDASGNVGIGTTTLNDTLTIRTPGASDKGLTIRERDDGFDAARLYADNSQGAMALLTGGTTTTLINGGANHGYINYNTGAYLGVGTNSPQATLHVLRGNAGEAVLFENNSSSFDAYVNIKADNTRQAQIVFSDGAAFRADIYADTSDNLIFRTNATSTEVMRLLANGQVGIGDTTPDARLDVELASTSTTAATERGYELRVTDTGVVTTGTDTTYGQQLTVTRTGATGGTINTYGLDIQATGDTGGTSTLTGLNVNISGADTNYAAIFQGGNVGIGDSTPAALFTVGSGGKLRVDTNGDITTAAAENLSITTGTTGILTIDTGTTGALDIGTGANAKTITVGNATGATGIVINTGTNGVNIGDNANTKTIDVGGNDANGADTVRIATNATSADTITIGSTHASSVATFNGGAYNLNIGNTGIGINAAAPTSGTVDLFFGNGANRMVNINQASSGAGNNLTLRAGQGATGQLGGDLVLQAGANGTALGAAGSVIVRANGGNTTAAFVIQQSDNTALLTADTTNRLIKIGTGTPAITSATTGGLYVTNTAEVAGRVLVGTTTHGIDFNTGAAANEYFRLIGNARNIKKISLVPEYEGATMTGTGSGTMTSDFCSGTSRRSVNTSICTVATEEHNYYSWTGTSGVQSYDIYVRYQLPSDFDGFSTSDAIKMAGWRTDGVDATPNSVTLTLYQANGTQCVTATNVATGTAAWSEPELTGDERTCTFTGGEVILFKITMLANGSDFVRAGAITLNYFSKF